ncbi:SCO2523 family variant P-loop protein [Hamadaea tsunoensis]|uniref:SCO2523 family variant P-loop protein n=1 Tax=Hamadaea tsunoensis TaxID=53368 RepID=UPI0003F85D38|nr:SCO2523 family variant P-loop protein [Hamadaea tsunoensis]
MLVFATSDKGGTGRSVTSCNIAYRAALQGLDASYLDFDFGSPTAGAIFGIESALRGVPRDGLHSYLRGSAAEPAVLDVWTLSDREALHSRPDTAGRLALLPGDEGGSEFAPGPEVVERCARLLMRQEEAYDVSLVDLSAGRSHALQIVLAALRSPKLAGVTARWLVFHRWTRQHIIAAHGLVYGAKGLLSAAEAAGHTAERFKASVRFVRTAVVDPKSPELAGLRAEQVTWLVGLNKGLRSLANGLGVGHTSALGQVPLDPVLQWREQIISDDDTMRREIANQATVDAFVALAKHLREDDRWQPL